MRRLPKKKLRNLMILFLCTGTLGIVIGLYATGPPLLTIMGVTQLCLGGVFGWKFLTQEPETSEDRRRRRHKR